MGNDALQAEALGCSNSIHGGTGTTSSLGDDGPMLDTAESSLRRIVEATSCASAAQVPQDPDVTNGYDDWSHEAGSEVSGHPQDCGNGFRRRGYNQRRRKQKWQSKVQAPTPSVLSSRS